MGKDQEEPHVIHIPRSLADDLQHWKEKCPNPAPEAFIFANQAGGFLDTDNYRKRVLHKLAKDLKLSKSTFRVTRRTIATLAQRKAQLRTCRECSGTPGQRQPPTSTCRRFPRACKQRSTQSIRNCGSRALKKHREQHRKEILRLLL
jgi:hypothetical protein